MSYSTGTTTFSSDLLEGPPLPSSQGYWLQGGGGTGLLPSLHWLGMGSSLPLSKIRILIPPSPSSMLGSLKSQRCWTGQVSTERWLLGEALGFQSSCLED